MAASNNPYLTMDDHALSNDFGFSTGSEDEISDLKKRLEAIRIIYMPLLQNLAKNSDQPIIKWPNRGPMLKQQMDKLISLTDPGFK